MATPSLTNEELQQTIAALEASNGNKVHAARLLGLSPGGFYNRLQSAIRRGLLSDSGVPLALNGVPPITGEPGGDFLHDGPDSGALRRALRNGRHDLDSLSTLFACSRGTVLDTIDVIKKAGYAVHESGGYYWLDTAPQAATDLGHRHEYISREDGSYVFGFVSDTHLGSKYARLDVLDALFARFAEAGVDRVFHAGNWIDGEASFNRHDLTHHGMHQQCMFLAERWPMHDGVTTYAVTGDDHEGWYSQREGIKIGRYAEQMFRDKGRNDWVDLGYMEADIALTHAGTGAKAKLRVAHPGGGSAYATSYAPQKYIESLDGGDKPAVCLLGHWHKMEVLNIRNVWVIQTGCTQDQTPFGRKKRLDFHVGGGLVGLRQDPETGAIIECTVTMLRWFNKSHYGTDRWSHSGPVKMADRKQFVA